MSTDMSTKHVNQVDEHVNQADNQVTTKVMQLEYPGGIWVALNLLTKRVEALEAEMTKFRGRRGRGQLKEKKEEKGNPADLFKEARDRGLTVAEMLRRKK